MCQQHRWKMVVKPRVHAFFECIVCGVIKFKSMTLFKEKK